MFFLKKSKPQPAAPVLFANVLPNGAVLVVRRAIMLPSGAKLIIAPSWADRFTLDCACDRTSIFGSFRLTNRPAAPLYVEKCGVYGSSELASIGSSPLDFNDSHIPLATLERIVARCYAILRDDAKRFDAANGAAGLAHAQTYLATMWRVANIGNFWVHPMPAPPAGI